MQKDLGALAEITDPRKTLRGMLKVTWNLCRQADDNRELALGGLVVATGEVNLAQPDMSLADVVRVGTRQEKDLGVGFDGFIELALVTKNMTLPDLGLTPCMGSRRLIGHDVGIDLSGRNGLAVLAEGVSGVQLGLDGELRGWCSEGHDRQQGDGEECREFHGVVVFG